MTNREYDGSVFADTRNIGVIREYASRMVGLYLSGSDSADYYVSSATYFIASVMDVGNADASAMNDEVDRGMSAQVAAEKLIGDALNRCIDDEDMTLDHFYEYTEWAIAYSSMMDRMPMAQLLRSCLDEPDACLPEREESALAA